MNQDDRVKIVPLGDAALLVLYGDEIELATNQRVHALDARLRAKAISGVIEMVPAYASLVVHYDPLRLTYAEVMDWVRAEMPVWKQGLLERPRRVEVPVRYGGEEGPDLEFVAAYHRVSTEEIVRRHTSRDYTVFMMGFTPGFPYMGKLEEGIATPRLETPRTRVPAGSVGIAGAQTGIYPIEFAGRVEADRADVAAVVRPGGGRAIPFFAGGQRALRRGGAGCLRCWKLADWRRCRMRGGLDGGGTGCQPRGRWMRLLSGPRTYWLAMKKMRRRWRWEQATWC